MDLPAFCVFRAFGREVEKEVTFDRHYLLYAAEGTMRLEAQGRRWSLPPARAALIAAGEPLTITIAHRILCCSVLFAPDAYPAPADPLTVFDMTPLARELVLECRAFGPEDPQDGDARLMFDTLAMLVRRLADRPSPAWIPSGQSALVRKALALTEAAIADEATFDDVARAAGASPRTLARRFADELGMPWQAARQRLRMIQATEALAETPDAVTEIAHAVGYASPSAFNAAFRDFAGMTPTEFRASLKAGATALRTS